MKLIEVIAKRIFLDFVDDVESLKRNTNLYIDLNLTPEHIKTIRKRIELIFSVRLPEELIMQQTTYGGLLDVVESIYVQSARLSAASMN